MDVIEPAAAVVLLRNGHAGLETFLMQRAAEAGVYAGAHVFPGGKLDSADHDFGLSVSSEDPSFSTLPSALKEVDLTVAEALALHVAALRELFEESGVWLGSGMTHGPGAEGLKRPSRQHPFHQMLLDSGPHAAIEAIVPWSRWITPVIPGIQRRRFDTRFFVAGMPRDQTARVCDRESVLGCWMTPASALARYWHREIDLAPPQIFTLAHLARCPTVHHALRVAHSRHPPLIEPLHVSIEGQKTICYPGDVRHPVREAAFPGVSRLVWTGSRFEPSDGLDAFTRS